MLIRGAAAILGGAGGALAIAQPGDLGGDESAAPSQETTTTVKDTTSTVLTTTTAAPETTVTSVPASSGASTTVPSSTDETTTTVAGSGLSVTGPASGGTNGMANTGGDSMVGPGLGLLGLGLLVRQASRRRAA
jgi:hypothetical protein